MTACHHTHRMRSGVEFCWWRHWKNCNCCPLLLLIEGTFVLYFKKCHQFLQRGHKLQGAQVSFLGCSPNFFLLVRSRKHTGLGLMSLSSRSKIYIWHGREKSQNQEFGGIWRHLINIYQRHQAHFDSLSDRSALNKLAAEAIWMRN